MRLYTVALCATLTVLAQPRVAGVGNFAQVDEHVYRGAQPAAVGFKHLAKLGVKTVIDLRGGVEHDSEKRLVTSLGMQYRHFPFPALAAPTDEQVSQVLALLEPSASEGWPVFIHCMRGKDRTGVVIACYRIKQQHWDNNKALAEAKMHGMSGMERSMQHYILGYKPPPDATQRASGNSQPVEKSHTP